MTLCSETSSYNIWRLTFPLYPPNGTKYNLAVWCLQSILWFGEDFQCIKRIFKKSDPTEILYQDPSAPGSKPCLFSRKFNKYFLLSTIKYIFFLCRKIISQFETTTVRRDLGKHQGYLLSPAQLKLCCRHKQKEGPCIPFLPAGPKRSIFVPCNTRTVSGTEIKCHLDKGHLPGYWWKMLQWLFGFYRGWNNLLTWSKINKLNKYKIETRL